MSEPAAAADRPLPPSMQRWERLARWLVRHRIALLTAAVVATAIAAIPASRLELDENLESFFATSDPLLQDYVASREAFGAVNAVGALVVGLEVVTMPRREGFAGLANVVGQVADWRGDGPDVEPCGSPSRGVKQVGWLVTS